MADYLWANASFAGEAVMRGCLLRNGPYLAMADGPEEIQGEVARLLAPRKVLPELDEYEGRDYVRVERLATLTTGDQVTAWVYFYRGS